MSDGRLGNLDSEHEQFPMNARHAPERGVHAHLSD